jgi:hypothetical protein
MKSYLVLSSEDSSQTDVPCHQCQILQQEKAKLREKQTRAHDKYRHLKQLYDDLLLKTQLLEENNKLLEATRVVQPQPARSVTTSQVSTILEDFDQLLNVQSSEILKLMEDRDRLSTVCFQSLNLLNRQDSIIGKFRKGFDGLLRFVQNSGESIESVTQDFIALGLDGAALVGIARQTVDVDRLVERLSLNRSGAIDVSEVLRTVSRLEKDALEIVTSFVMQQVSKQRQLNEKIESEKQKKRNVMAKLASLIHSIKPSNASCQEVFVEINRLKRAADQLARMNGILRQLVRSFESFGSRFPENNELEKCLVRIRSWLQNENNEVDVVQEIDFVLGLCLPASPESCSDSSSVASLEGTGERRCQQMDGEILRQIRELKQTVCDMKDQIRASENERRGFITRHFKRILPMSTRWAEICEYLLSAR